jgi:hypothetical protein
MSATLIFDGGFDSTAIHIAIATQFKLRDLPMQAGRGLDLDNNFMLCCSIQERLIAA